MSSAPRNRPTSLAWFPYLADEWERRCEPLTLEQEAALTRACRRAWLCKEARCTLADTPAAWEKLLGARWRALLAFLRTEFVASPEHPGRVVCPWLLALWEVQAGKYQRRAPAGAEGGRASGHTRRSRASNTTANGKQPRSNADTDSEALTQQPRSNADTEVRSKRDYVPTAHAVGDVGPPAADAAAGAPPGGGLAAAAAAERQQPPGDAYGVSDAPDPSPVAPLTPEARAALLAEWETSRADAIAEAAARPTPRRQFAERKAAALAALGVAPRNVFADLPSPPPEDSPARNGNGVPPEPEPDA